MKAATVCALLGTLPLSILPCTGQTTPQATRVVPMPVVIKNPQGIKYTRQGFTFARIRYKSGRKPNTWATDYPDAELNLTTEINKATGLECNPNPAVIELSDPALKDYPFVYMAEGGQMMLEEQEIQRLREHLLGGGFLMVDDFWGEEEWGGVAAVMRKVFPDRAIVDLPIEHEIFRCFYLMTEKPQIPNISTGIQSQKTGVTWERPDGKEAHYRGILDDRGRVMAIFCHNTDLGDGWERASESAYYSREFSQKRAYPLGINIVVYALTH